MSLVCDCTDTLKDKHAKELASYETLLHMCKCVCVCCTQNMEDWDQDELERVVKEKHAKEKASNETKIICKFFLEAVETKKYGW